MAFKVEGVPPFGDFRVFRESVDDHQVAQIVADSRFKFLTKFTDSTYIN